MRVWPSLFMAHGSPMLALEDTEYTRFACELGRSLGRPRAVVLFSAHWESSVQAVGCAQRYETIHDFYGFPETLYQLAYPAIGDSALAQTVASLLANQGIPVRLDENRGLDHGAWMVLRWLYPDASVPVVAMSVAPDASPAEQYAVGRALAQLRRQDVLVLGSGGTVHNLRALRRQDPGEEGDAWALAFEQWLEQHVAAWDLPALFHYAGHAPYALHAVPPGGNEHFIPLFYAMGAADDDRSARLLHRSFRYGNLSHTAWQFG
ncbi:MAG: dioxygenase [Alicyclobacillus sp.]|nr:dioxygenase [Alicyclobacillus sp.]